MFKRLLRPLVFFLFLLTWEEAVVAQHYFFIEADKQQPFYVRYEGQLVSSSAIGFLLVPKVTSEKFVLTIGFPRNQYPEQHFELTEMDRDRGFQLKDFGEKGWGLFDRVSLAIIMPQAATAADKALVPTKKSNNGFADVLAEVTGDSTLIPAKPMPKPAVQPSAVTVEKPAAAIEAQPATAPVAKPSAATVVQPPPAVQSNPATQQEKKPVITSIVVQEDDKVRQMMFVEERSAGVRDTIRVEIAKKVLTQEPSQKTVATTALTQEPSQKTVTTIPVCDRPFADVKDFRNLQRRILGLSDLKEQITVVVKALNEKCYSSRQVMDLGWLFTDERHRLSLFEAILGKVADPDQFGKLEAVFMKDENVKAFRRLIGQN